MDNIYINCNRTNIMTQVNFYCAGKKIKNKDMSVIPRGEDKVCIEGTCYKIKSIIWGEEGIDHCDVVEIHLEGEAYVEDVIPHGIRSNNPGNIINNGIEWKGLADHQFGKFYRFKDAKWGIRAMRKVLDTYKNKHLHNTVSGIISRWAPEADNNDTGSYIRFVSNKLQVGPKEPIDTNNDDVMVGLISAIIEMENGFSPYGIEFIKKAINIK